MRQWLKAVSLANHSVENTSIKAAIGFGISSSGVSRKRSCRQEVLVGLRAVTGLQRGRTKAVERERVKPVEVSVIDATLKQLRPMVADMVRIQLLTGMRPGELCQMQASDIDRIMSDWRYTPSDHKMIHKDCVRLVAIGPKAQEILDKYLSEEPCFVGERGSRMTTAAFRDAIHRACDKAKVARWNPNQLRHNAATKITSEYDLETARAVLSHSDTKTTEIYAERDYEIAKEVALAVGNPLPTFVTCHQCFVIANGDKPCSNCDPLCYVHHTK